MREFANGMQQAMSGAINAAWLRHRSGELCLALALAPVFTWAEPFGVDDDPFLARLGFWGGVLASWFIVTALTEPWLARSALYRDLGPKTRRAAVIALAALPMIPVTGAAINALNGWEASFGEVSELYFQIIIVGSLVTMLGDKLVPVLVRDTAPRALPVTVSDPPSAAAEDIRAASPSACPLIARLPTDLRGPVLCLEMQDHYVRVHTGRGAALVLMRLRDAIAETAPVAGRQVHRSWWVADEAVERFERAGRAGSVRLRDGRRVPVSQRYLQDVEQAWGTAS
ncbi:response regulator receiver protein [Ancylobacter novellus DSM 506]|uniref:Response regulator receiver protein n=1 Tax=Ancylobacter novellus (strain ATCC 8093 / DSM 506 / JCM 20403 / CCM 1077 / IAM 12100 / NBRC 12443 / NCIMB 10456) TaxID=639283 RepID=D7A4N6_ANCN5|nr:LytTR family DNA-binding domain-containing protein [Ancylobacter novellus]ADH87934.1 response regulator receiver protein [Ancylobacter novellus DSM 506]